MNDGIWDRASGSEVRFIRLANKEQMSASPYLFVTLKGIAERTTIKFYTDDFTKLSQCI